MIPPLSWFGRLVLPIVMLLVSVPAWAGGLATISTQPADVTAVEGDTVSLYVDWSPNGTTVSKGEWYRNGVLIGPAKLELDLTNGTPFSRLNLTTTLANSGSTYYFVLYFNTSDSATSNTAKLTVLPAGSKLPAKILSPADDTLFVFDGDYSSSPDDNYVTIKAEGFGLTWEIISDGGFRWTVPPGSQEATIRLNDGGDTFWQGLNDIRTFNRFLVRVTDRDGVSAMRSYRVRLDYSQVVQFNGITAVPVVLTAPDAPLGYGQTLVVPAPGILGASVTVNNLPLEVVELVIGSGGALTGITKPPVGTLVSWAKDGSLTYRADLGFVPSFPIKVPLRARIKISGTPFEAFFVSYIWVSGTSGAGGTGPGDLNRDGVVNALDLNGVSSNFGKSYK